MSATLPNPQLIAKWLNAKFYTARYRLIPFEEHLVYENGTYATADAKEFFRTASSLQMTLSVPTPRQQAHRIVAKANHHDLENPMTNAVVALAVETAIGGHGAMVFCSSRAGAERMASLISDALPTDHLDHERCTFAAKNRI